MYRRSSLLSETPDESNFAKPAFSKYRPSSAIRTRPPSSNVYGGLNQRLTSSNLKFQQQTSGNEKQSVGGHVASSLIKGSRIAMTTSSRFKPNKETRFFTKKDHRMFDDKNYQNIVIRNMIEHLISLNCVITEEELRSPTTKGFQRIFEKMWQFFDPNFKYTTTQKVQEIYRLIGYPFPLHDSTMKTITANHSWWRVIMVALDWLRQLSSYALSYHSESVLFANSKDDLYEFPAHVNLEIFLHYVQCYALKLGGNEDYERLDEHFREVLNDNNNEDLKEENAKLLEELQFLEAQLIEENELPNEIHVLELDIAKITDYIGDIEKHIETVQTSIKEGEKQCEICVKEIGDLREQISRNEILVQQQEVTQDEVKQIFLNKQTLLSQNHVYQTEIEKLEKDQYKMDIQICNDGSKITAKMNDFKQKVKFLFNCNKIKLDQNWLTHLDVDYSPTDPELLVFCKTILRPGVDIANELANQVLHKMNAELRNHQETIESIEESLANTKDEIQNLDEKLIEINKKISDTKEGKNRVFLTKKQELDHLREQEEELANLRTMNLHQKQEKLDTLKQEYRNKKEAYKIEAKEIMECFKKEMLILEEHWEFIQNLKKEDNENLKNRIDEIVKIVTDFD